MTTYRFPKQVRLLRACEFDRVFAARVSAADGMVVLYGAANDLGYPRLGLTVSRKVGSAVERNRWKRALREAFRLTQSQLPALDLVCLPRAGATADLRQLRDALPALAARIQKQLDGKCQQSTAGDSRRVGRGRKPQ